jgi:hypothetical protein
VKSRTCPHCGRAIPVGESKFDDKLNLICPLCQKIIVPVEPEPLVTHAIHRHYPGDCGGLPGFFGSPIDDGQLE